MGAGILALTNQTEPTKSPRFVADPVEVRMFVEESKGIISPEVIHPIGPHAYGGNDGKNICIFVVTNGAKSYGCGTPFVQLTATLSDGRVFRYPE